MNRREAGHRPGDRRRSIITRHAEAQRAGRAWPIKKPVQPAPEHGHPRNPQPVHTHLLIENGVYIMESLDLETIAADRVYEFLFVGLPTKVKGATGSMLDPVAVV